MMFNTYDVEDGKESEETQERRSKRNRGDITDQHTLLTVPAYAKCYKGRPVYKWNCTQKAKYRQLACSWVAGNRNKRIVDVIRTTGFVNVVI